ncbi:SIMPL domain-containing protein [Calothrix sp. UHCC 0171]|uniref:SIMPL domain-containing protein n=1 Tax=Calothrix sp. UHCC 0171 TaxID=3110245 RepID=UPI002B1F5B35|nr:SIMPL domain-containing protein [Calothrix sp. UHCC 0171]MEA5574537.1 SIMPL domain-containing protein [Calothrix sp. UHCC 0171]
MNKLVLSSSQMMNTGKIHARRAWKTLPIALLLCVSFAQPSWAQEKERMFKTLTVSGRGVESIPTTRSQVNVGVEVQGKDVKNVQEEAARRSSAVVELLKSRNVEKLQTTGINLNPVYSYTNNVQKITGYSATNTVSFRVATEKTGTLLDDVVKAGATRIDSISFAATDEAISQAQKRALQKATQDAKLQADAVFETLGFKAKEVVSIQLNGANTPPPRPMLEARSADAFKNSASTPVVGGEQEVEASVTLQISY